MNDNEEDPIVAEIRQYRAEHAAKYDHDLSRICQALHEAEINSGHRIVQRNPRLLKTKAEN